MSQPDGIKAQLDDRLKQALLAGDKELATTLRGLKSAVLYVELEKNLRDEGLSEEQIVQVFRKEAKKRQESADLYKQGGSTEKANHELEEKEVIESFLPPMMDDESLLKAVDETIAKQSAHSIQQMGSVLGALKQQYGSELDAAKASSLVKERLSQT